MAEYESLLQSLINKRINENTKTESNKVKLLDNPKKLDEYVGKIAEQLSPGPLTKKKAGHELYTDRVDTAIPEGHPLSGIGSKLKSVLSSELASPKNRGYSVSDITTGVVNGLLKEPDDNGISLLERVYETKRYEDTSFMGSKLKAPTVPSNFLSYEEWRSNKNKQELSAILEEQEQGSYFKNVATATGLGGALGGIIGNVPGAISGAVAGAVSETIAYPIRNFFERNSEWARSRKFSRSTLDRLKVPGLELGTEILTGSLAANRFTKALAEVNAAKNAAIATPTAENIVNAVSAESSIVRKVSKNTSMAAKAVARSESTIPGGVEKSINKEALSFVSTKLEGTGVTDKVIKDTANKFSKLDNTAKTEALNYKDGLFNEAVDYALERQESRKFFTGENTVEQVKKNIRNDIKYTKVPVEAQETARRAGLEAVKEAQFKYTSKSGNDYFKVGDTWYSSEGDVLKPFISKNFKQENIISLEKVVTDTPEAKKVINTVSTPTVSEEALTDNSKIINEISSESTGETVSKVISPAEKTVNPSTVKEVKNKLNIDPDKIEDIDKFTTSLKGRSAAELTDELTKFEDKMVAKYFPDEDLSKVSGEDLDDIYDSLPDKLTDKEFKIYDSLNTAAYESDNVSKINVPLKEAEVEPLSIDTAMKQVRNIISESEDIHPTVSVRRLEKVMEGVIKKGDTGAVADEFSGKLAELITTMKKKANIVGFLAAFGVSGVLFDALNPKEGEAANISGPLRESMKLLLTSLEESGLSVPRATKSTLFRTAEGFQRGLSESAAGGPMSVLRNVGKVLKTSKGGFSALSPGMQFDLLFNIKEGMMNSPAVFKATFFSAEANNINDGIQIFSNILKKGGIKPNIKAVEDAFEPLIPLAEKQIGYEFARDEIVRLDKQLNKMVRTPVKDQALLEDIQAVKKKLAIYHKNVKVLRPEIDKYHQAWAQTASEHVNKPGFESMKVFLAADDNASFTKYPFLKGIQFTDNEQLTVGRLKKQMAEYGKRLEAAGIKTRTGDYMHYSLHPKVNKAMLSEMTGEINATPFMKNYSRTQYSRPLVPDAFASIGHYVPDVERRLQTQLFWNSDWKKVRNRLRFVSAADKAFEALEKGTAPFEKTLGNKAAAAYTMLESFKRLALNPSAGVKHLVKLTGDMATLGPTETLGALPSSLKGVTWRIIGRSPKLESALKSVGLGKSSDFDKVYKQTFNSIVPALDTRYRMMQLGFTDDYSRYFDKFLGMTETANNVGAVWINLAELIDRGVSFEAGLRIAAKKGMTPEQSLYGIYDLILRNNFLGREFSPRWIRNPKMKALMMFQVTPFKIAERRLVNGIRAGRAIKGLGKELYLATRTAEGRAGVLEDFKSIRKYMNGAEQELQTNIFVDSLRAETDFFGNTAAAQFARDIMIIGAGTGAGAYAGMNLWHHFFHLPFISGYENDPGVHPALSPGVSAVLEGYDKWKKRSLNDDDWLTTKIVKQWIGNSGPFPDIITKVNRISKDDIPAIYNDSKFKYFFAIPGTEE